LKRPLADGMRSSKVVTGIPLSGNNTELLVGACFAAHNANEVIPYDDEHIICQFVMFVIYCP
jgi:hypothetical protein